MTRRYKITPRTRVGGNPTTRAGAARRLLSSRLVLCYVASANASRAVHIESSRRCRCDVRELAPHPVRRAVPFKYIRARHGARPRAACETETGTRNTAWTVVRSSVCGFDIRNACALCAASSQYMYIKKDRYSFIGYPIYILSTVVDHVRRSQRLLGWSGRVLACAPGSLSAEQSHLWCALRTHWRTSCRSGVRVGGRGTCNLPGVGGRAI